MELKKGDTFTIECEVVDVYGQKIGLKLIGDTSSREAHYTYIDRADAFKNIKRAPVEPKAGQTWKYKKIANSTLTILYADLKSVLYETSNGVRGYLPPEQLLSHYEFLND